MLTQPLIQRLQDLRLRGMAAALARQTELPDHRELSFEDRLGLLIEHEIVDRQSHRLAQRLRWARLPQSATLEDLDLRTPRGLDRAALKQIASLAWIDQHAAVLIVGPTGVGKSYLACALGHAACRADHSVRCFRIAHLVETLTRATALQQRSRLLKQLARIDLLIIDDFGLAPLSDQTVRDLLDIFDDRYQCAATLITSQLPVDQWHAYLGDPTLADAILDRLVHHAHRLVLSGESMRKQRRDATRSTPPPSSAS
jgi:DNA replication protein DnaC